MKLGQNGGEFGLQLWQVLGGDVQEFDDLVAQGFIQGVLLELLKLLLQGHILVVVEAVGVQDAVEELLVDLQLLADEGQEV